MDVLLWYFSLVVQAIEQKNFERLEKVVDSL